MSQDILDQLYPWQAPAGPGLTTAELSAAVNAKRAQGDAVRAAFFETQMPDLIAAATALAACFRGGGRLFTIGNGGSACDAAHIAVEFAHPVTTGRPALPSLNLCADTALLTALSNDVGADEIFARQIRLQARPGDALIGVSTSGNSSNLLAAFRAAAECRLCTIALSGAGGGALAGMAEVQHCLSVPGDSVHRIQETQLLIYHLLWDLVHALLEASA